MQTMLTRTILVCLAVLVSTSALAGDISGDAVIKNRVLWRDGRHQLSPLLGATLLDHYQQHILIGAGYKYYPLEWLGIGAEVLYASGLPTSLVDDIEAGWAAQDRAIEVTSSRIQLITNAIVELAPLSGKATILNKALFYYDFHVVGGIGFATVKGAGGSIEDSAGFSPMFGVGTRIFLLPGIALTLDFRDYLVSMVEAGSAIELNKSASYVNNFSLMFGVDFMLPFDLPEPTTGIRP